MNNTNYIYIDFEDLKEEAQEEILELAREEVEKEGSEEDEKEGGGQKEDIITDRVDEKLWKGYMNDKVVFRL